MCHYCFNDLCLDSERICGCNPRKEQRIVEGSEWPKPKLQKPIECEYCAQKTGRTKGIRPNVDFVFRDGIHLCLECASKKRCSCGGELSRLGCMLCRKPNQIRDVLEEG